MRFFYVRPLSYFLVGLLFVDLFGAIPFGILNTADTSVESIGTTEWIVTAIMSALAIMIVVAGFSKRQKVLDYTALAGGFIWIGTSLVGAFQYASGTSGLDLETTVALSSLALGVGILHLGIQRVAVLPDELKDQMRYRYKKDQT
jgi:hypothetical protein